MKIVINKCYGGFSLSHKAVMRFAELKNMKLYPWIDDISSKVYGDKATLDNPFALIHYATVPEEEYKRIEAEETKKPVKVGRFKKSDALYFSARDIPRTDPVLIRLVEEMGTEIDGRHSKLVVIEIPDGVDWTIEEYDGREWVAEKHRTWDE